MLTQLLEQTPDCALHQINLGLWVHLLDSCTTGIKNFLQDALYTDRTKIFSDQQIKGVWHRMSERFEWLDRCTSGMAFSAKITSFAVDMQTRKSAQKQKICVIEGREHFRLMLVSNHTTLYKQKKNH